MRKGLQNILNISFTDTQLLQATLPIRLGGMGIRRAESLAIPAFLASAAFTSEIQSNILGALIIQPDPHYANLSEHWQALTELLLTDHFPTNSQAKLDAPLLQKEYSILLQSSTEPSELTRLKAVSFQHAGDWLNCLPIKSCGLGLSDEAIRVAVGLCLGANLCQPHTCACGVLVHQRSRHASINDLIYHSLNKAGFPAIKEPQGILRSDGRRPDGTTLIPRRAGRNLVWDAAVIDTLAPSYLQATAATAGAAAEIADAIKTKKYQDLLNTHQFIPLSMETLGPINETGITFVADIGRLLTQATDEGRETSFIFQRLSVTIQRFNAVAGTFTAPLPEFEQRLFDRRLHHSRYRPSFVDRGNQSESPRCHDSLSPIANLTNSACASPPPTPPAVHVFLDATRDSVHHREIGHTCGSLR